MLLKYGEVQGWQVWFWIAISIISKRLSDENLQKKLSILIKI